MKKRDREYFLDDLRGADPRPRRGVKLDIELLDHSEHQPRRKCANSQIYEEICSPARLTNWKVDLGQISPWAKPDQDMRNAISLETALSVHTKPGICPTESFLLTTNIG